MSKTKKAHTSVSSCATLDAPLQPLLPTMHSNASFSGSGCNKKDKKRSELLLGNINLWIQNNKSILTVISFRDKKMRSSAKSNWWTLASTICKKNKKPLLSTTKIAIVPGKVLDLNLGVYTGSGSHETDPFSVSLDLQKLKAAVKLVFTCGKHESLWKNFAYIHRSME